MAKITPRQRQIDNLRSLRGDDNNWVFDNFDKNFEKNAKMGIAALIFGWLVLIAVNIAIWGGLIWFVFFLLNKYGVI